MTTTRVASTRSVITNYFDAKNRRDVEAMLQAFAPSATVRDENIEHAGDLRIRHWLEHITNAHHLAFEVVETTPTDRGAVAIVRASGDVPGSPFIVRYAFTLSGNTIARLEIDLLADATQRSLA